MGQGRQDGVPGRPDEGRLEQSGQGTWTGSTTVDDLLFQRPFSPRLPGIPPYASDSGSTPQMPYPTTSEERGLNWGPH